MQEKFFMGPSPRVPCCKFCTSSTLILWLFSFQARFFFQQLISGVSYCHSMVLTSVLPIHCTVTRCYSCIVWVYLVLVLKLICHRDLKLENTLLDGSMAPRVKICDFGYSKVTKKLWKLIFILQIKSFFLSSFECVGLFAVSSVSFSAEVNCRNASLHCSWGAV